MRDWQGGRSNVHGRHTEHESMEAKAVLPEPVLINTEQTAALLNISKRHFLTLMDLGEIGPEPIRLGRRCLYAVEELRDWATAGCPGRAVWAKREA